VALVARVPPQDAPRDAPVTETQTMRIYLAGPLFSMAERMFNQVLCEHLEKQGLEVFLPQRDVNHTMGAHWIYLGDVGGLANSHAVVAIMDGPDHDSGTAWECGYAVANQIPVVLVRTDMRQGGDDGWGNLMLTQSADETIEHSPVEGDVGILAARIAEVLESINGPR
jgi:nucleoside 2-deoxyribosyltransferase